MNYAELRRFTVWERDTAYKKLKVTASSDAHAGRPPAVPGADLTKVCISADDARKCYLRVYLEEYLVTPAGAAAYAEGFRDAWEEFQRDGYFIPPRYGSFSHLSRAVEQLILEGWDGTQPAAEHAAQLGYVAGFRGARFYADEWSQETFDEAKKDVPPAPGDTPEELIIELLAIAVGSVYGSGVARAVARQLLYDAWPQLPVMERLKTYLGLSRGRGWFPDLPAAKVDLEAAWTTFWEHQDEIPKDDGGGGDQYSTARNYFRGR